MTPKEVLIAAKALIDTPRKWGKVDLYSRGRYCALGALCEIQERYAPVITSFAEPLDRLCRALPPEFGANDWNCADYNDDPKTTHKDVMAWFDRAIEAAS